MQSKVLAFLTFNVSTCIKKDERSNSINRYNRFTHMCRAGFADGIQIITVLATFGLFLEYLKYTVFGVAFLTN